MRFCHLKFTPALVALLAVLAGCQGPIMSGGFNVSPYRDYGVDGPGPGVLPENYQRTSYPGPMPGMPEQGMGMMPVMGPMGAEAMPMVGMMQPMGPTSQVNFRGPESMIIRWDATVPGTFDSDPCVCPATHDFVQGNIYRLKISNIPGYEGKDLFPTLEIAPTMARTQAFLGHNTVPIEFTDNDFEQVFSGNFITKVIYLPNPEFQGLAMAGVGTLVNTQLEAGADPIVEASNRGAILAIIRMGNKDLSGVVAERKRMAAAAPMMMQQAPAYPVTSGSIPQNAISGVNVPAYGTPMTKTSTGIPGPPQLPRGQHATDRHPVIRAEPIPAPPRAVGYDQQNVVYYPNYTTQMQVQQQMQVPANPTPVAPTPVQPQPTP